MFFFSYLDGITPDLNVCLCPADDMSLGLGRLKNLGLGLQSEIDDQDVSLDALLNKVDTMDGKISSTNRQLKNLK